MEYKLITKLSVICKKKFQWVTPNLTRFRQCTPKIDQGNNHYTVELCLSDPRET